MKNLDYNQKRDEMTMDDAPESPEFSFEWSLEGEKLEPEGQPLLLGRNIRYKLNVKAVTKNGTPLTGIKYFLRSNKGSNWMITISGQDDEQVTTETGNNFEIFAFTATNASQHAHMNQALTISLTSDEGVVEDIKCMVGRLAYWGSPHAFVDRSTSSMVFSSSSYWAGEGGGDSWHWDSFAPKGRMKITSLEIDSTRFTYESGYEFKCDHLVDLKKFEGLTEVVVEFFPTFSDNGYTGVLPRAVKVGLPVS
ncbi:MAG: hypothetical protein JWR17_2290 [Pseudomonas sp.]|uniref:hypothetical protein n=1 Tax=Pseudomonas sp. TaxID=306 RepID=UPI002626C38D|nr:hypothetical protein [Pseudomonas sp.]MDB6049544.1 hypothetical protein [Pseudomonas sp.]